jgi:DivIVA domain-containing protein
MTGTVLSSPRRSRTLSRERGRDVPASNPPTGYWLKVAVVGLAVRAARLDLVRGRLNGGGSSSSAVSKASTGCVSGYEASGRLGWATGALAGRSPGTSTAGLAGGAAKLDGVSSRGQSLSMFVVQRSFRTVRRGYDRDEVDRHLELVSQWFTSTDAGRAFTHQRRELEERERALAAREAEQARLVEGARLEADATLDGARRRADAAAEAAERTLADARAEAETIRADAERERAEILDRARAEAAAAELVRVAEERAAKMLRDASSEAETMLARARADAQRQLTAARQEREQRLADARAEAARLAERLRADADEQLRAYSDRRRREADRLAQAARRQHRPSPP